MRHNYGVETKKTTLMMEDGVYTAIRETAARRGTSISAIVSEALAMYDARPMPSATNPIKLTVAAGGGWIGPVSVTSNAQLFDSMNGDVSVQKLR